MRRFSISAATLALAALMLASSASGLSDLIEGGTTRLKLDRGVSATLRAHGVRVVSLRPARLEGRVASMPVTAGQLDPAGASGTLTQAGGIGFVVGTRTVHVDRFGINTAKRWVSARIGGEQVRLASFEGFRPGRQGFGSSFEVRRLPLTREAADLLDRKLGLGRVLRAGRSLGSLAATTVPRSTRVESGSILIVGVGGYTYFAKLKEIGADLRGFEVSPESSEPPTWRFPLITGAMDLGMQSGFVGAEAGWRIYANPEGPGSVMTLTNMSVQLESPGVRPSTEKGTLTARMQIHDAFGQPTELGTVTLGTFDVAPGTQRIEPAARTMTLLGTPVTITPYFADRLNEIFAGPKGKPNLFEYGEPIGGLEVSLTSH